LFGHARVSIGLGACDPPCICDVNATATVTAADALSVSQKGRRPDLGPLSVAGQSTTYEWPYVHVDFALDDDDRAGHEHDDSDRQHDHVADDRCPSMLDLHLLVGVRDCAINDDCAEGMCDDAGSVRTATQPDVGYRNAHDADVVRLASSRRSAAGRHRRAAIAPSAI
jgi:hypothetical protein